MAAWRFGRGWRSDELQKRLAALATLAPTSTAVDTGAGTTFNHYGSEATIAHEPPGPAGPVFSRAKELLTAYAFSDPRIVRAHFDDCSPLRGRDMLLEIRVLGLRYLCGTRIGEVRDQQGADRSLFGFRYDTLVGHLESGSEWFLLAKDHRTGNITLGIRAAWRPGQLPNWWSEVGFHLLARRYQRAWHRLAHLRMRTLLDSGTLPMLPHALVTYGRASQAALDRFLEVESEARPPRAAEKEIRHVDVPS